MPKFTSVPDEEALQRLFDESHQRPVVLFLHDEFCGVSSMAYDEMLDIEGEVALIDVTSQHDVKRAVERLSGVKHQSPQAIVLRNGKPAWDASHGRIRAESVSQAVAAAG
jgi:bacillithiol system protein YtxJ